MTGPAFPALSAGGVSVEASQAGSELIIAFSGNADMRVRDEIQAFLLQTHGMVQAGEIDRVVVDFRALEFMNSACIKAFVNWLAEVQALEQAAQYHIHFLTNPTIHWQRRSLRALSCFAADLVRIGESP